MGWYLIQRENKHLHFYRDNGFTDQYQQILRDNSITSKLDNVSNEYRRYQVISFKAHLNFVIQTSITTPLV